MSELLRKATEPTVHRGLEGVVVDESELSYIDGNIGRLIYRGFAIEDLAREASFEEVCYLLWNRDLPTADELDAFVGSMADDRSISAALVDLLRELAASGDTPMAALRTATSMLSAADPEPDAEPEDLEATQRKGRRITAKLPTIVAAYERLRNGDEPIEPDPSLSHATNFLYMLTGDVPDEVAAETFDMALTLHADHGLNASTFTTLVIVSTYADVYNAIPGGIGALAGPWHGGANQDVMHALMDLDESDQAPIDWVEDMIESGERIPGWGHRVYNVKDPRAVILQDRSEKLAESTGVTKWYEYTTAIEDYLTEEKGLPEKGIAPNVDFYSGTVYYQLDIPIDLYTPIFAMSRVAGWLGHILEYQQDNRLIRPRAKYVGPMEAQWVPVEDR